MGTAIIPAETSASLLVCDEQLSFWGGVDSTSSEIIDAHHPQNGESLAGKVVLMPSSRGSCTGSGVLLDMAFNGVAPRALIFRREENILTLGALIADRLFGLRIAVLQLAAQEYDQLVAETEVHITSTAIRAGDLEFTLDSIGDKQLELSKHDQAYLDGDYGEAARFAMDIICTMATIQGAPRLVDVTRVHIDACIYAGKAFLTFAQSMLDLGAKVQIPTTTNAISVDHANWRSQSIPDTFGLPASQLADAYTGMGAKPSFTCAPYLLENAPCFGESIAWAESNAVVYANSVLGARSVKHADFMDLCVAITGRTASVGVYLDEHRRAQRCIDIQIPQECDDSFWPLLGWLVGQASPDRIPLVRGIEKLSPSDSDLKAMCAAFGTTSSSPMLHIAGITPESCMPPAPDADAINVTLSDMQRQWKRFNQGAERVDLVALGSPHFSTSECVEFAGFMEGSRVCQDVTTIITVGRDTMESILESGTFAKLEASGVQVIQDICWCSISEPVFPPAAEVVMTNSGKYAHYAPGLSGRKVRFGSLQECAESSCTGRAPTIPPRWLSSLN